MVDSVRVYLQELHDLHQSGVGTVELTNYTPLLNLLNAIGSELKPVVKAVSNLADKGAGHPDMGLFTADQAEEQLPERGVIEVKGTAEDTEVTARSDQVKTYLDLYGQVLVTNYWHFILVVRGPDGDPVKPETFALAEDEATLWAQSPTTLAWQQGTQLIEYLKRVMLRPAAISRPRDVAWFLASYARDALARIEVRDLPGLETVQTALEDSLGTTFSGEEGDRFFRSTMVQTLFYGIFSAWVLWHKENPAREDKFNWHDAAYILHVPVIKVLFEQLALPSKLEALDLEEVLDWVEGILNRVNRGEFFSHFEEGQAVQYFYEPFLEAFSPQLRKDLGVWYTPREVVKYMVERVDTMLREELGEADGLASKNVYVLDPASGTGAYLVAVLEKIASIEADKGKGDAVGAIVKEAIQKRIFGFELLPAPFVIAHLQLGLLLRNLGAPLKERERPGVFLTNSLTGWNLTTSEAPEKPILFPEFENERDAARVVKQKRPILVVLGNPPYNAFAGVSPSEEQGLVEPYKEGLIDTWNIRKFNLDDLYVRFFRIAEHRIAEVTGRGIICYISNFSYLDSPSFVVMRQHLLNSFDEIWIDCLNGDSRETGKTTPDGRPDPSVFSTKSNPVGIQVGTTIGMMLRNGKEKSRAAVYFRNIWGVGKRLKLLQSVGTGLSKSQYETVTPSIQTRLAFRPSGVSKTYLSWPSIPDLSEAPPFQAFMESRRGALVDIDKDELENRMKSYFNKELAWNKFAAKGTWLSEDAAGYNAKKARQKLLQNDSYRDTNLRRYTFHPFDNRWCYITDVRPLWHRARPDLLQQTWAGNEFLVTRMKSEKKTKGSPTFFSTCLCDYQALARNVSVVPLHLRSALPKTKEGQSRLALEMEPETKANLSYGARVYLQTLGLSNPDGNAESAKLIWMHVLAITYAPSYLDNNAEAIRMNWPRIPLPNSKSLLVASGQLGKRLSALLNIEEEVATVTSGNLRPELKVIGTLRGSVNSDSTYPVKAGWGYLQQGYKTMPSGGDARVRDYTHSELSAFEAGAKALGLTLEQVLGLLGEKTYNVHLNDEVYWQNVPANVWDFTVGGFQVIKKWLSYRERQVLGRNLTINEVEEVMNTARRIAAILLMHPQLDANFQAAKTDSYTWPEA